MKKIVLSLFPLVLVVICSVSAFAEEHIEWNSGWKMNITSVYDTFSFVEDSAGSRHLRVFTVPSEREVIVKFLSTDYDCDVNVYVEQMEFRLFNGKPSLYSVAGTEKHVAVRPYVKKGEWIDVSLPFRDYYDNAGGDLFRVSVKYECNVDGKIYNNSAYGVNFQLSSSTAPPIPTGERKVSWSTFGNRTTQFGEYLPLDGLFMRFQLYTGDIDKHKYKTYIQEFNNDGQTVGKRLDIPTELFSDPLNSKTTYEFTIYLQRYLSLKMGRKYVFYLEDITSGEIVSSIGFRPTINIVHILNTPNLDNVVETPNYDLDTDIVPMPPSDSDIIPVFPEEDGVVGIGKKITWFFTAITSTIDFIFTSFLNLLDIISNSCTQFIKFLGSFFSYLPKEIVACLSLSFIAIIVLRFLKR